MICMGCSGFGGPGWVGGRKTWGLKCGSGGAGVDLAIFQYFPKRELTSLVSTSQLLPILGPLPAMPTYLPL